MPFGNFREPMSSLKRAHFIYNTKEGASDEKKLKIEFKLKKYNKNSIDYSDSQIHDKSPIIAFCGIANPQYFMTALMNMKIDVFKEIKFENHAKYDPKKYQKLKEENPNNLSFITTSKDFVKLDKEFISTYTIYILEMNFVLDDSRLLETIRKLIK
tara:strand:- start:109 stop:576 length:468 start_codon:yes stop_codon:yes gene_type:complete